MRKVLGFIIGLSILVAGLTIIVACAAKVCIYICNTISVSKALVYGAVMIVLLGVLFGLANDQKQ